MMKLFKETLKLIAERMLNLTTTKKSHVKFGPWANTSVDPSYVFRTERGRRDLDAISKMNIPNRVEELK